MSDLFPPYPVAVEPLKRHCEHCRLHVEKLCEHREGCANWPPKPRVLGRPGGCYHCKQGAENCFCPEARPAPEETNTARPGEPAGARDRAPKGEVATSPILTEGVKHDGGKPRMELLSRDALEAEARVLAFGAEKYAADNWRLGMDWRRLGGAAMRHLLAWMDGEDIDPETGLSHLAHLRCCAGFLIEYQARGLGTDDRFKR